MSILYFHISVIVTTNVCHYYHTVSLISAFEYSSDTLVISISQIVIMIILTNVNNNYLYNINSYLL